MPYDTPHHQASTDRQPLRGPAALATAGTDDQPLGGGGRQLSALLTTADGLREYDGAPQADGAALQGGGLG